MFNTDCETDMQKAVHGDVSAEFGDFYIRSFSTVDKRDFYEILRARADVFTGEKEILYPDADGIDYDSIHVFGKDDSGMVTSYLRIYPKTDEPETAQIGRVLTRVHGRGTGTRLLAAGMNAAADIMHALEIYLESQKDAVDFYLYSGFSVASDEFIEAGIPHVQMRKKLR